MTIELTVFLKLAEDCMQEDQSARSKTNVHVAWGKVINLPNPCYLGKSAAQHHSNQGGSHKDARHIFHVTNPRDLYVFSQLGTF